MLQENTFNLSDSDEDENDYKLDLDLYNESNISTLDNLDLKYYPEPYGTLAQYILSSIIGSYMVYLKHPRKEDDNTLKNKLVDNYFKYCQNVDSDEYLNKIFNLLDLSNDNKIVILNRCKSLANELINRITYENTNNDSLELVNIKLIKETITMIKFSNIYGLLYH